MHGGQQRLGRRFPVGGESHRLVDPRVDGPQLVGRGGDTVTDRGLALDDVVRGPRRNGVRVNPEPSGDGSTRGKPSYAQLETAGAPEGAGEANDSLPNPRREN